MPPSRAELAEWMPDVVDQDGWQLTTMTVDEMREHGTEPVDGSWIYWAKRGDGPERTHVASLWFSPEDWQRNQGDARSELVQAKIHCALLSLADFVAKETV